MSVAAARRGDRLAQAALLRMFQDQWYRMVLRLLGDVEAAREATQEVFLFYSLGLAGHALIQILARAYYAARDTTTPLALTLISIGLNVVLDVLLAPLLFVKGLALANSISTLVEAGLLLVLLTSRARLRLGPQQVLGPGGAGAGAAHARDRRRQRK